MFNPYETNLHAFLFCLLGVKSGFYPIDLGKKMRQKLRGTNLGKLRELQLHAKDFGHYIKKLLVVSV